MFEKTKKHFTRLRAWAVTKEVDPSGWIFYTLKNKRNVEKRFGVRYASSYELTFCQDCVGSRDGGTLIDIVDSWTFLYEDDMIEKIRKLENKWTW